MTWYISQIHGRYYWLDPSGLKPKSPILDITPSVRELLPGENFVNFSCAGTTCCMVLSDKKNLPPEKQFVFPEKPTFASLTTSLPGGQPLDQNTYIYTGVNGVELSFDEWTYLRYFQTNSSSGGISFFGRRQAPYNVMPSVAWYQKYLGKQFTVSVRNGFIGIENKMVSWEPITAGLEIDLQTGKINNPYKDKHLLGRKILQEYIQQITPGYILKIAGPRPTLRTRCPGCQVMDVDHLAVHLQGGELNLFLIFAIYDFFGKDAVDKTFELLHVIKSPTRTKEGDLMCQELRALTETFFRTLLFTDDVVEAAPKGTPTTLTWRYGRLGSKSDEPFSMPPNYHSPLGGTVAATASDIYAAGGLINDDTITITSTMFDEDDTLH
jgi:hypothetical protein